MMKKRKKILSSTTKPKKKKKNYYFNKETQEKIVEYQNSKLKRHKDILYQNYIHPAFTELVHNLVSVYNYKSANENIVHLKSDCVTFLFETIHKWNPDNGTKAFSYFNVVAKNWLTIHSKRLLKNHKRSVYIDDYESLSNAQKSEIFDREYVDGDADLERYRVKLGKIVEIIDHINDSVKDERDRKCCFAIRKLFNTIDDLEFFNKRAIFVYLREISGLNSSELSSSLSNIRKIYKKVVGHDKKWDLNDL